MSCQQGAGRLAAQDLRAQAGNFRAAEGRVSWRLLDAATHEVQALDEARLQRSFEQQRRRRGVQRGQFQCSAWTAGGRLGRGIGPHIAPVLAAHPVLMVPARPEV